jgi:hypothetical protein
MLSFPFTFSHAGRTFSVVSDWPATELSAPSASTAEVFVRIVGVRGLHELGLVDAAATPDELRDRVCEWYERLEIRK